MPGFSPRRAGGHDDEMVPDGAPDCAEYYAYDQPAARAHRPPRPPLVAAFTDPKHWYTFDILARKDPPESPPASCNTSPKVPDTLYAA